MQPGRTGYATKRIAPHGYKAVTKPLAHAMYNSGYPVTMCGNNVNSYHVFNNWYLGHTIQRCSIGTEFPSEGFEHNVMSFKHYMESELGSYVVYYVKTSDLESYQAVHQAGKKSTDQAVHNQAVHTKEIVE